VVLAHGEIDGVGAPGGEEHSADGGEALSEAPARDWGTRHEDVLPEKLSRASLLFVGPVDAALPQNMQFARNKSKQWLADFQSTLMKWGDC
jgi:hypothetical protein